MTAISSTSNRVDSTTAENANNKTRPNVLFISVDDLNDWVGALGGYPGVQTPNIDRLAQRGTLFTRAYCPVPICNGARTSVMTGLQPDTTGVYHNSQDWRAVVPDAVTIPEHFMQNGYEVVGAGKLFHGDFDKPEAFNQRFKPSGGFKSIDPPQSPFSFGYGPSSAPPQKEVGDFQTAQFAADYINQAHNRPFFLGVGISKPHTPWVVPQEYFDQYPIEEVVLPNVRQDDLKDIPQSGRKMAASSYHRRAVESGEWKEVVQSYLASISYADAMIGKVLDALSNSPHADNTIVVLWSDHGSHLGEKLHWGKATLWEEATRIPMIIAAPGVGEAGQVAEQAVSSTDLYPTLVDLADLPQRSELDGASLTPLLQDPKAGWDRPAISTWEFSHAVRTERWRYIRHYDGKEELYDHRNDPGEFTNLADEPKFTDIKAELADWLPVRNNPVVGTPLRDDTLNGGSGNDTLIGDIRDKTVYGQRGDKSGDDILNGRGGDDRLDGRGGNDILNGSSGDDTLEGWRGKDILNGGPGNDTLRGNSGITFKGGAGNDFLISMTGGNTFNGGLGNDTLKAGKGDDILTGGGGQDRFVIQGGGTDTINDFGGMGIGSRPATTAVTKADTLQFEGAELSTRNMVLTQKESDLQITFAGAESTKVILKDFDLEDLENLHTSKGAGVDAGNILFDGQTQIENSFDVFNADSQHESVFHRNSVTFLNNLDNKTKGLKGSNDVINGQDGNDELEGLSGNDIIHGGRGNDTLIGNYGNDVLVGDSRSDVLIGSGGDDVLSFDTADRLIKGGTGTDTQRIDGSNVNLNLATTDTKITGIEVIDLAGASNSLTFNHQDLLDLSPTTNQLIVNGNTVDKVTSTGQGWTRRGIATLEDDTRYNRYTLNEVTVLVETDITQIIS